MEKKEEEEFKLDLSNIPISQLGFIYGTDIEKEGEILEKTFGFPKFQFGPIEHNETTYRGKTGPLVSRYGFSRIGKTQIELSQWIEGESLYKEFLEEGKKGLHHICFHVGKDIDLYVEDLKKKGIKVAHSGIAGRVKFAYMETFDVLGFRLGFIGTVPKSQRKKVKYERTDK